MKKLALPFCALSVALSGVVARAEYKHAEYIRLVPNGKTAAYVKTGIGATTATMEFKFKFLMEGSVQYGGAIRDYYGEAYNTARIIYNNNSTTDYLVYFMSKAGGGSTKFEGVTTGVNQIIEGYLRKTSARLNNVEKTLNSVAGTANTKEMQLMSASGSTDPTPAKIYKFQVWDTTSNTLIKEFVPVYNPENPSDCGFWDGKTVRKAEAGTLEAGPAGSGMTIEVKPHYVFDGVHPVDEPIIRDAVTGAVLEKGVDYDCVIEGTNKVGTATVTVTNKKTSSVETTTFEVTHVGNVFYATPNPTYDPTTGVEIATPKTVAGFEVEAWSLTNALNRAVMTKGGGTVFLIESGDYAAGPATPSYTTAHCFELRYKTDYVNTTITIKGLAADREQTRIVGKGYDGVTQTASLGFVNFNHNSDLYKPTLNLENVTFTNFYPRVVTVTADKTLQVTVTNCTFRCNGSGLVSVRGGCFYGLNNTVCDVFDSHFEGNEAYSGGVVSANNRSTKFYGCTFDKNKATNYPGVQYARAYGAVAYNSGWFTNCTFDANYSAGDNNGGGSVGYRNAYDSSSGPYFVDCLITNTTAASYVFVRCDLRKCRIVDCRSIVVNWGTVENCLFVTNCAS